jgi:tRNA-dihydrouridine synthase
VAAIGFHPRPAAAGHKGEPDYALAAELAERLDVPVIISGGLDSAESARRAYRESGADAVMIARGSFGWPWIFEELLGTRDEAPSDAEVVEELLLVVDQAEEHFGAERASRYLRKFYPWYLDRLGAPPDVSAELQRSTDLTCARELIGGLVPQPAL